MSPAGTEAQPQRKSSANNRLRLIAFAGLAVYLVSTHLTMGIRTEHIVLATVYVTLVAVGGRAFKFLGYFLPCVLTGVTYDYFRLFKGLRGEIHVSDLYGAELAWFGIGDQIPADWFLGHTHAMLDLICGLSYILYLYVPIVTAIILFFRDEKRMLLVGLAFLATNLLGMVVYFAYPAAPPWYVAEYGLGPANLEALPSAAGAVRFDQLLGVDYFTNFYARSANVFGAMPSLHVAYPMSTFLAVRGMGRRWTITTGVFTLVVGFAAVYLQHHYVIDVLAGFVCAVAGYGVAWFLCNRTSLLAAKEPSHA